MVVTEKTCHEFLEALSSGAPVPGGGGAAALCGALGAALSNMVGNLTICKKKYAGVQDEINDLLEKGAVLIDKLERLIREDGEVFQELHHAYSLPKGTPAETGLRETAIEERAKAAAAIPLEVMRQALAGLKVQRRMAQIGTVTAASDAGCGAVFLQAALLSGELNVLANLKIIKDNKFVTETTAEMNRLREDGRKETEEILELAQMQLRLKT